MNFDMNSKVKFRIVIEKKLISKMRKFKVFIKRDLERKPGCRNEEIFDIFWN